MDEAASSGDDGAFAPAPKGDAVKRERFAQGDPLATAAAALSDALVTARTSAARAEAAAVERRGVPVISL